MKKVVKKITSLSVAVIVLLATLAALPVSAETGSWPDGYAYLYFNADSLDVEAPESCKVAYQVNDGKLTYVTSNFAPHWVRVDVDELIPNGANKVTFYTGDANGILDESKSRNDAGTGCCDYIISTATLALILPNGKVLENVGYDVTITTYSPKDATTPLDVESVVATSTAGNISIGGDKIDKPYKVDVVFYEEGAWDGTKDPVQKEIPKMKNVSLQIGATADEKRFVWYSFSKEAGYVQITTADKLANGEMPADAEKVLATSSVSGDTEYYSFHATINKLSENTEYAYRVGNDEDGWSPVYTFKTDNFNLPYSFVATGDVQIGQVARMKTTEAEIEGWKKSLGQITEFNPDASFLLSLGDQVSDAHIQSQYDGLFAPEQMTSLPLAVVYGNHDPDKTWTKHYNIPNTTDYGVAGSGACDYSYVYGDTLYMHINTSSSNPQPHIEFLRESIKKHPDVRWAIVIMHHAFFGASTTQNVVDDDWALRIQLAPEFSKLGIDVVLSGHQHNYCRAKLMNGKDPVETYDYSVGATANPNAGEVLYVSLGSGSGSAANVPKGEFDHIAYKCKAEMAMQSNVELTEDSFAITTYRTDQDTMSVVDAYTLKRDSGKPTVRTVFVSPETATVKTGYSQKFEAEILGYNNPSTDVIWTVSGNKSDKTTISADGILSIDIDETAENLTVTATSVLDATRFASATVAVSGNAKLIDEDFESGAEGTTLMTADGTTTPWNGWRIAGIGKTQTPDTVITLEKEKYTESDRLTNNMFAKIERTVVPNSNSANATLEKNITAFTGGMFSIKFRLARNETAQVFGVVVASADTVNKKSGSTTIGFNFTTGKVTSDGFKSALFVNKAPAEIGKWYEFEILVDVDNNKSYVYCDGKLIVTGTAGSATNASKAIYGLSSVSFKSDRTAGATAAGGAFWLDDICVKQMTSEDAVREAAKSSLNSSKARISADTINLPKIGYYEAALSWESSNPSVINAETGAVTRPQNGEPVSVTLTATAVKDTETFSYEIPVLVNPKSVIFDESFEQPQSFNGQTLDGFNGWENTSKDTTEGRVIDSAFTVNDDADAKNKVLLLSRLADVSEQSKDYTIIKALPEKLNNTKASLKFKISRASDASGLVSLYLYNSDKSQVLKTSVKLSDCSVTIGESTKAFFDGNGANTAEKDKWYNFEMLFDLENGACDILEGGVNCATTISQLSDIAYIGISTERADAAISNSETLVDDIVFKKLTDEEYEELKNSNIVSKINDISYADNSLQVSITNSAELNEGISLYAAVFDKENAQLSDVAVAGLDATQRAAGEQIVKVSEVTLKEPSSFVKVFVWDDTLTPVCEIKGATINLGN